MYSDLNNCTLTFKKTNKLIKMYLKRISTNLIMSMPRFI